MEKRLMSKVLKPDLCVIGAGSGGLTVAAGAAQMGATVVLVEGHKMGGDCLNYGCVPSKSLLAAGKRAHAMTAGAPFGVATVVPKIDFAAAKVHVRAVIAAIEPHDSQERFEGLGVTVLRDWARFVSPTRVVVGDSAVEARRFVIATGSSPAIPPIPGIDQVRVHTNEDIFDLIECPKHLIIIGGGPIGIELAQAHRRLGAAVTVLEAGRALGREDPEMAALVLDRLRTEGIEIVENASVESVRPATGGIAVRAGGAELIGSHLLVAAGRRVNLERLDLAAGGVRHTERGIAVDRGLRSVSNRRVYAIGDAAGGPQFTHLAGYHGGIVIRSALFGLPVRARDDHIPRVTFSEPELAQVGLTEAEARARHGSRLEVLTAEYAGNDRAQAERATEGRIKVMVVRSRPVGATIVGANAGDLISVWALALSARLKIAAIAGMVAPYPTYGELSKRAAGQYYVPRLFQSPRVKRVVRFLQRWLP
jgi:pyruvate/2-oxoglutarate dehydrogenase complex dihydrolipoamide dehydrogenase (E3) component